MRVVIAITAVVLCVLFYRWHTGVNRLYKDQVSASLASAPDSSELITVEDLQGLPEPLVRFMNYTGVVGTEHVTHFKVVLKGNMKMDRDSEWSPVTGEQYTFINEGRRLFKLSMKYRGLQINGVHHFYEGNAFMTIKILDLFQVVHNEDAFMKKGETVTWFNDMCILAPGALLNADIVWEQIDKNHVKGSLTHDGVTVAAILTIDDDGKLTNFVSEDRYAAKNDGTYDNVPWSTPITEHRKINGLNLSCYGNAVWHYEDEVFNYFELDLVDVVINPKE